MKTILWLGGWASSFATLKPWLLPLAPDAIWIDVDCHALAREPNQLASTLNALPEKSVVMAWSLGSLLLLRHLQVTGKVLPFPVLLLSPIARLTGPGAPWPYRMVTRMRRHLIEDKETVLQDFWNLMASKTTVVDLADSWLQAAKTISLQDLDAGLAALQDLQVDTPSLPQQGKGLWILGGAADAIIPFEMDTWQSDLPQAAITCLPCGHLPFVSAPDAIRQSLDQAWATYETMP
jgi:pimeloyl-ACP methyl ester carboxylesterase